MDFIHARPYWAVCHCGFMPTGPLFPDQLFEPYGHKQHAGDLSRRTGEKAASLRPKIANILSRHYTHQIDNVSYKEL